MIGCSAREPSGSPRDRRRRANADLRRTRNASRGVQFDFIPNGKPVEKAHIESFKQALARTYH